MFASKHAHAGALDTQILTSGRIDEGSCSVPIRIARYCGVADELANRCAPQPGQKCREIRLPLSAVLAKQYVVPETSMAALGKIAFAVPLPEIFWQSRHQQMRATIGSPVTV
jgi:hypothetical protein